MNNIFRGIDVGYRFDLKGSTQGRRTLQVGEPLATANKNIKVALKDLDFNDLIKKITVIQLKSKYQKDLLEILDQDA